MCKLGLAIKEFILVDTVAELAEKSLVVLLGNLEDALDELSSLVGAELAHVDLLVLVPPPPTASFPRRHDGAEDPSAEPVVGGKLLQRGPPQRVLVVLNATVVPARDHLLHPPIPARPLPPIHHRRRPLQTSNQPILLYLP